MQTTKKTKEVSARVVVTPMPEDGTEQFNFIRRAGTITANEAEALLQFYDHVPPKDLFRAMNKLVGSYINEGCTDISSEEAIAIEHTYNYLLNRWEAQDDGFEPYHPTFLSSAKE